MRVNTCYRRKHEMALAAMYEDFVALALHEFDGPDYNELAPISTTSRGAQHIRCAPAYADCDLALSTIAAGDEPLSRKEMLASTDIKEWLDSEVVELDSMKRLEVFDCMRREHLPRNKKVIRQKWVYKRKPDRYKARLVAKGFMQSPWDIGETYAPVTRLSTVRTLLAIAAGRPDWDLRHLDISTAFINATLKEEVYMECPDGYGACTDVVCGHIQSLDKKPTCEKCKLAKIDTKGEIIIKLKKAIYGLKQSPRDWYDTIVSWLTRPTKEGGQGFSQSPHDPCLISKIEHEAPGLLKKNAAVRPLLISKKVADKEMWIALYVDDLLMAGHSELIEPFVKDISKEYVIRDLGVPEVFLGCEIHRSKDRKSIEIKCKKYIESMTKKFGLLEMAKQKPCRTPLDPQAKLTIEDQSPKGSTVDPTLYRGYVGSVLYAAQTCRPDIAYAVKELSRFLVEPLQAHLNAAQRLVCYLYGSKEMSIKYTAPKNNEAGTFSFKTLWNDHRLDEINGYSDADWAGELPGRKSTSGYVFMINGGAVSWKSQTQPVVALSTAEAEYVAISEAAKEALYLRKILAEFKQTSEKPVVLFEDNSAAATWTRNETDHQKSRHIDVRYHHIRDHVAKGDIVVHMCPTQEMVADIMTKALEADLHKRTAWRMMGHLPEMAHPQHAKKPMSTPKPISKPVAERFKMGESKLTSNKPAPIQQTTFRSAGAAAQATDTTRDLVEANAAFDKLFGEV